MRQCELFDFSWKQQLTSWTVLHNLYTIWLLNKLTLVSSWIESHALCFIPQKMTLKIRWPFVTDCVPSLLVFAYQLCTESKNLCFYWGHFRVSFFFYPKVKNLKLCPFVTYVLFANFIDIANYCWPLLKLPLAFLLKSHGRLSLTMVSSKGWRWVFWLCLVILFCYECPKC